MFGRSEFQRRVGQTVDAALVRGEQRRAAAFLRGPGPMGTPGTEPPRDGDWVLVVTDRRVLLVPVTAATRTAGGISGELHSYPLDGVRVLDAALRGIAPVLVLRFPDAVLGWFHPLPAWRRETAELVTELRRGCADSDPDPDSGDAYPDENRPERIRRAP